MTQFMFFNVLSSMLTLCILMGIGFLIKKFNVISDEGTRALSDILVSLTLPCLTVMAMQKPFSPELLVNCIVTIVISVIIHLVFYGLGIFMCRFIRAAALEKQILIFAMTFSNLVYMGFPIITQVYGEESLFYGAMGNIVFNVMVFTLGVKIINKGDDKENRFDWKKILNPVIVSAVIGIIFFVLSIKINDTIASVLTMVGNMTTPLSMIVIGALLTKSNIKSLFMDYRILILSFARLIFAPLVVFLPLSYMLNDHIMLGVLTVFAGMPAAAITAIFAQKYGSDAVFASKVVFLTTIISVFTIPLCVYFI